MKKVPQREKVDVATASTPTKPKISWPIENNNTIRDSLALELFGVCAATLLKHKFNKAKLVALAQRAVRDDSGQLQPVATAVLSDMWCLGELGSKWGQDPSYLDAYGRPRILNIRGRTASLQTLVKEFFGRRSIDEVVDMGCRTRVMRRVGTSKVSYFGGCVMFTEDPLLILAHSVRSARWFLETSTYNHKRFKSNSNALPDRAAYAVVPREDLVAFTKFMRGQVSSLIEMSDRWLTARAELKRNSKSKKKITLGVQAFVFQDRAWSPR